MLVAILKFLFTFTINKQTKTFIMIVADVRILMNDLKDDISKGIDVEFNTQWLAVLTKKVNAAVAKGIEEGLKNN